MVRTPKGKLIHFGGIKTDGTPYEHFRDSTGLGLYSSYDHNDRKRRRNYRKRHRGVLLKNGKPAYRSRENPSYFSYYYLW